jgi:hypothetical protein
MSKQNETGHIINIAAFSTLISYVGSLGSTYNPSNDALKPGALKLLHSRCEKAHDEWSRAYIDWKLAVAERINAFSPLGKLATRIINAVSATGIDESFVDNGRPFIRLLRGKRLKPKRTKEQVEKDMLDGIDRKEISVSRLSYDMRIDHFRSLIAFVQSVKEYSPNEQDLRLDSLKLYLKRLEQSTSEVYSKHSLLYDARAKRNHLLYGRCTGLIDMAQMVKRYVKAVYGPTSEEYRHISKIYFRKRELKTDYVEIKQEAV